MKTDYDARGFAARYRASRPLDADVVERWATILREETPIAVGTVLDLGAGVGRFWPVFRRAWAPTRIVAVDRSAEMLEAADGGPDVETVVADLDALDPTLCRPQVAFCSMSLHYSGDPIRVCAAVRSMLPDGGVLLVRTSTREIAGASAMLQFFPSAVAAEAAAFSSRGDIEGWMRAAGFAVHSRVVAQPAAPSHPQLLRRTATRGLPALQRVPVPEFIGGVVRLALWCVLRGLRREPVPMDETLLVVGVVR